MDQTLQSKLEEMQQSLEETFELALTYGDHSTKNENTFLNFKEQILLIQSNAAHSEQVLQKANDQPTLEDLDQLYTTEIRNKKNFMVKRSNEFKNFERRLKEIKVSHEQQNNTQSSPNNAVLHVECDEFVMETHINIIDPLTKKQMENPVRNNICGHHYEKSSMQEAIKINKRLRCPVAGCGNNTIIKLSHLVDDPEFKKKMLMVIAANEEDDDEDSQN